jgi:glycerol-1-phosphate dehydrogenase [NAD(P)+]
MKKLNLINDSLNKENIEIELPFQSHVENFSDIEFLQKLKQMVQPQGKIFICHDGVLKSSTKTFPNYLVDGSHLCNFLVEQNFLCEHINIKESVFKNFYSKENNLNPPSELHASVKYIEFLKSQIKDLFSKNEMVSFVVFGSGTVTDLLKHSLFELKNELNLDFKFICIPTALTVTAFTSHFSVLDYGGAKRTKPSLMPSAVFWVKEVLQQAPKQLNKAGYGDLLARFVAYGDWYLAYEFGVAARYDEKAFRLMEPFSEFLQTVAPEFQNSQISGASIEMFSECLSMAGIAMSVSGETTPLSGFEHTISHCLDYLNLQQGSDCPLHGEQVALGTLISARCFEYFINSKSPLPREFVFFDTQRAQTVVKNILKIGLELSGCMSAENFEKQFQEIWAEYGKKHENWILQKQNREQIIEKLPQIKSYLKKLVIPYAELEKIFIQAQMPFVSENLLPPQPANNLRWAVRFSPFIRARVSLADILFWLNQDPAIVAAI